MPHQPSPDQVAASVASNDRRASSYAVKSDSRPWTHSARYSSPAVPHGNSTRRPAPGAARDLVTFTRAGLPASDLTTPPDYGSTTGGSPTRRPANPAVRNERFGGIKSVASLSTLAPLGTIRPKRMSPGATPGGALYITVKAGSDHGEWVESKCIIDQINKTVENFVAHTVESIPIRSSYQGICHNDGPF